MNERLRNGKTEFEMLLDYAAKKGIKNFEIKSYEGSEIKKSDIVVIEPACYDDIMPWCEEITTLKYRDTYLVGNAWAFEYGKEYLALRKVAKTNDTT